MSKITTSNKKDNFVILDKTALNDTELSWQAKGVHSYLMSLPNDWQIYLEDLEKRSSDKRDCTANCLQELVAYGYIQRTRLHNEKGHAAGYDYVIFEQANPELRAEHLPKYIAKRKSIADRKRVEKEKREANKGESEIGITENGKAEVGKADTNKDTSNQVLKELNIQEEEREEAPTLFEKKETPKPSEHFIEQKKKETEKSCAKKDKERKCINSTCKNNALPDMGVCSDCNEKNKARLQGYNFKQKSFTIPPKLKASERAVRSINEMNWGNKPAFSIESELMGMNKYSIEFIEHHLDCAVKQGWKSLVFINKETGENDTDKLYTQFCTRNGIKTQSEFNAKLFFDLMQTDRIAWGKLHKELLDSGYENVLYNGKIVNMSKNGQNCDDGLPPTFNKDTFQTLRNINPNRANYYAATRKQN